jgi:hypothetical protein
VSSMKAAENVNGDDYYYNQEEGSQDEYDPEIVVTTRALAFAALWTAVLSALMSAFGTVILGWQSPLTGQYYTCCSSSVHRTTPLGLGSFIGALLMLSNLTLICSVMFGEFEVSPVSVNPILSLPSAMLIFCHPNEDSGLSRSRRPSQRGWGNVIPEQSASINGVLYIVYVFNNCIRWVCCPDICICEQHHGRTCIR